MNMAPITLRAPIMLSKERRIKVLIRRKIKNSPPIKHLMKTSQSRRRRNQPNPRSRAKVPQLPRERTTKRRVRRLPVKTLELKSQRRSNLQSRLATRYEFPSIHSIPILIIVTLKAPKDKDDEKKNEKATGKDSGAEDSKKESSGKSASDEVRDSLYP
jgi:hypothetical protein